MKNQNILKIAIQKSGRLSEDSIKLFKECGIKFENGKGKLKAESANFPAEFLFLRDDDIVLRVKKEIMPNGYLKISQESRDKDGNPFRNIDIYHKQMSVLPYASSVGSVMIKPTEEGVIRHKALQAMEEQTSMHLNQIREQIELLARQAQEIRKRKELSMIVYGAKLNFQPVIGHIYYLFEKKDDTFILSMVSPAEWGASAPFKQFIAAVRLLADHTWVEVTEQKNGDAGRTAV